jgi:hypothetical protein
VPVKIHDESYVLKRVQKLLDGVDLRVHPSVRLGPLAVEVEACKVGPEIAVDDAVGVDHGDNYQFVVLEKFLLVDDVP